MSLEDPWAEALVTWYRGAHKPLPWRSDPRPYPVWIGEVMSQQTSLKVVVPRFAAFLAAVPDVRALAGCCDEDLRALWAGLGYYARARNLQKGARWVVSERGGELPRTSAEWRAIPGCGPYTAAIIASVCFGERTPAMDGNVTRVTSRLGAMTHGVHAPSERRALLAVLDGQMAACSSPGDFNQALMELGQEICLKARPRCALCPVAGRCLARARGIVDLCPPPRPRPAPIDVDLAVLVIGRTSDRKIALGERRTGFLARTFGFPLRETSRDTEPDAAGGWALRPVGALFRHTITRHRIRARVLAGDLALDRETAAGDLADRLGFDAVRWTARKDVERRLATSLDRKAWEIAVRDA